MSFFELPPQGTMSPLVAAPQSYKRDSKEDVGSKSPKCQCVRLAPNIASVLLYILDRFLLALKSLFSGIDSSWSSSYLVPHMCLMCIKFCHQQVSPVETMLGNARGHKLSQNSLERMQPCFCTFQCCGYKGTMRSLQELLALPSFLARSSDSSCFAPAVVF